MIEVRRMLPGDEDMAVKSIWQIKKRGDNSLRKPIADTMSGWLALTSNYLIVASELGEPLGFASGYCLPRVDRDRDMMYLHEIEIVEGRRNKGIGQTIMNELRRICENDGFEEIFVITDENNIAARRLYVSAGKAVKQENSIAYIYPLGQ